MYDREHSGGKYASESGDNTKGITDVITSGLIRMCFMEFAFAFQLSSSTPCGLRPEYNPKDDLDLLSFFVSSFTNARTMPAKGINYKQRVIGGEGEGLHLSTKYNEKNNQVI